MAVASPFPSWRIQAAWGADISADPATWTWSDIPATDVRSAEDNKIVIVRGRRSAAQAAEPATVAFSLHNKLGQYTPGLAAGVNYPNVRQNTPIRVYANPGSGEVLRGTFFVDSWVPQFDSTTAVAWCDVSASGLLRRLGQGTAPQKSAIYRQITGSTPLPLYYWPCEDATGSTSLAEYAGGPAMTWLSTPPTLASATSPGSDKLPKFDSTGGGTGLVAEIPTYTSPSPNTWQVNWLFNMPQAPSSLQASPVMEIRTHGSSWYRWTIFLQAGSDEIHFEQFDSAGSLTTRDNTTFTVAGITEPYGRDLFVELQLTQSGGNVNWLYRLTDCLTGSQTSRSGSYVGTVSNVRRLNVPPGYDHQNMVMGHVALYKAASTLTVACLDGNAGDPAATRMTNLCANNDVPFSVNGTAAATSAMGPQTVAGLMTILRDCEAVDGGILSDGLSPELRYRTRAARYDLTAVLTASLTRLKQLAEPFQPVYDDLRRRNDWTVSRTGGSSARVQDAADVTAHGLYDDSVTLNVQSDDDLADQAGWRVNLGTVEGLRYPSLSFKFGNSATQLLMSSWLASDIGDRFTVTDLPTQLGASAQSLDLVVEGYTEVIGFNQWDVTCVCSPYAPWQVFKIEDTSLGRLQTDGSTLVGALTSSATGTFQVARTDSTTPLWTTTATFPADFPLDVDIDGEQIRISAITGTSSPQTFTISARAVNGVSKAHSAGAAVSVWQPPVLAL